jgi:hypothetical protein
MDMDTIPRILDSDKQSGVIAFFLISPPRGFSMKELAKRLHTSERSLKPILNTFERLSLVTEFKKDRQTFYLINEKHKLLPAIKQSLLKNQKHYEDELFSAIKKLGEIKGAFLSGVFVGQSQLPVDLLLVGKVNLKKLDAFLDNLKKVMGVEINYSVMPLEEFQLRRDTFDRFIRDIFDYRHIVIVDNTMKRGKK